MGSYPKSMLTKPPVPSRGLLRNCEIFANLRLKLYEVGVLRGQELHHAAAAGQLLGAVVGQPVSEAQVSGHYRFAVAEAFTAFMN